MKQAISKYIIVLICCAGVSGCITKYSISEEVTALNTTCDINHIQISTEVYELNDDHTWTAKCNGKTYYCSDQSAAGSDCVEVRR